MSVDLGEQGVGGGAHHRGASYEGPARCRGANLPTSPVAVTILQGRAVLAVPGQSCDGVLDDLDSMCADTATVLEQARQRGVTARLTLTPRGHP